MEYSERKKKNIFRVLWAMFLTPVIFATILIILISNENVGYIPPFEELENPKSNLASEIISGDGVILGKYYKENRTIIDFKDLSPNVVNALLATEDIRFYDHSGIDMMALLRVAKGLVTGNTSSGGGSTISQQLAKNLYNMRDHARPSGVIGKIIMKLQEWVTAIRLERRYTKDEIMIMYLNTVAFGHNAYGIESASKIFFNKAPQDLKIEEASVLVGLLKAPTKYSPKKNPKTSKARRNTVLSQIEKYQDKLHDINGFVTMSDEEYEALKKQDIKLNYSEQSHNEGLATYFREYLRGVLTAEEPDRDNYADWQEELYKEDSTQWADNPLYGWCNKNTKPDGTPYNVYNDGLKIYVTINSKMQKYAEEAVAEHMGLGYTVNGKTYESLQSLFERVELKKKKSPFSWRLKKEQIDQIMIQSIKRSDRYRVAKKIKGLDSASIWREFKTPVEMSVFSWHGNIDTVMTPWDSILYYKRFLRAGFMSMDPMTGFVKAYVGGINYQNFKYDHVSMGRRQVGSSFKPFVYTMAMMHGIAPCHKVPNIPVVIDMPGMNPPTYTPKFSPSKLDGQMISLKTGLAMSLNQISAWVMKQFSPQNMVDICRKLGIQSPLEPVPSLCVGAAEVKVKEMVAAYCGFANKGMYTEPIFVTTIKDKNDNIIATFQPKRRQALDEVTAYKMIDMMEGVINYGTGNRLRRWFGLKNRIAGKTGTTNLNADGWFMGITPKLVSGAWVGGEERNIQFTNGNYGQGAQMALPIWGLYMYKIYQDKSLGFTGKETFEVPENYDNSSSNCSEYSETDYSQSDVNTFNESDNEVF